MSYIRFIFETLIYFINYFIAIVVVFIIKKFNLKSKENIWVFGGNGGNFYADNSAVLHQYVKDNHPKITAYWIINKSSLDKSKIKNHDNVLFKHSIKANVLAMIADVLICSHSIRGDIMRASQKRFRDSLTVDLFHGITAFKDKEDYPKNDLVIATSEEEKKIKLKWPNNHKDNIVITGFPRFDELYRRRKEMKTSKEIFYMPTWRPWLKKDYIEPSEQDRINFQQSKFYLEIYNFLTNERLHKLLNKYEYTLNVFVHMNMHQYIDTFKIKDINIKFLERDIDVQKYLINSEVLITDYSSVAWDFLYLNKPTFFYVFDLNEYQEHVKSCIRMPEELFGPVAFESDEMISSIEKYLHGECKFEKYPINDMRQRFIKYDDNRNCERVIKAIMKRLSKV